MGVRFDGRTYPPCCFVCGGNYVVCVCLGPRCIVEGRGGYSCVVTGSTLVATGLRCTVTFTDMIPPSVKCVLSRVKRKRLGTSVRGVTGALGVGSSLVSGFVQGVVSGPMGMK